MSKLGDLDRQPITYHCDKWDRDVVMRPISAHNLAHLQVDFATMNGTDTTNLDAMTFYAELLSHTVVDPEASKEEWLHEVTVGTVMELGQEALRVNGLATEEAKKK